VSEEEKLKEARERINRMMQMRERLNRIKEKMNKIKYKIGVISGKGGVGKSTVTALLALAFASKGYKVAVFDSDFHGPSIPKMLGVEGGIVKVTKDKRIIPVEGPLGIKVISIYYFLPDPTTAVIWRGPLKRSFFEELLDLTEFGDLDILLFDLPPGTGDEALNLAQVVPGLTGVIAVTQPTDVSAVAVAKAIDFANKVGIRVLGIIENMSGFLCPGEGKIYKIFHGEGGKMLSVKYGVPLLGQVPIDPRISEYGDKGLENLIKNSETEIAKEFIKIAKKLIEIITKLS